MPTDLAWRYRPDGHAEVVRVPEGVGWLWISRSHARDAATAVLKVRRDRVASISIGGANERGRASEMRVVWLHEADARRHSAWWTERLGRPDVAAEIQESAGEWPEADPLTWEPVKEGATA